MHELPIIERILKIALKHAQTNKVTRVVAIKLQIGQLSDLEEEWIQRYFQYLSRGTLAEDSKIKIEWQPIVMQCCNCMASYEVERKNMTDRLCPVCGGRDGRLLSGKGYSIKEMEVQ